MSLRRGVLIRVLALLQRKTLIETKNRTLKCLKWHYLTVRSMKNVAVLTEDGAFPLFFRPHPGGFDSSRVPTPGNLPSKAKKMLIPGGQPGGGLGGIDWCIMLVSAIAVSPRLSLKINLEDLYQTFCWLSVNLSLLRSSSSVDCLRSISRRRNFLWRIVNH